MGGVERVTRYHEGETATVVHARGDYAQQDDKHQVIQQDTIMRTSMGQARRHTLLINVIWMLAME